MPKPTPTQEELDRAALGEHVLVKEPDGSGLENPPDAPDKPPDVITPLKKQRPEVKPAPSGDQPHHPPPLKPTAE